MILYSNDFLFSLFFCFPSAISFLFFLFYLVTFLVNLLPLKGHSISFTGGAPLLSSPLFELYIFELRVNLCFLIPPTFVFGSYVTVRVVSINKKMQKKSQMLHGLINNK